MAIARRGNQKIYLFDTAPSNKAAITQAEITAADEITGDADEAHIGSDGFTVTDQFLEYEPTSQQNNVKINAGSSPSDARLRYTFDATTTTVHDLLDAQAGNNVGIVFVPTGVTTAGALYTYYSITGLGAINPDHAAAIPEFSVSCPHDGGNGYQAFVS